MAVTEGGDTMLTHDLLQQLCFTTEKTMHKKKNLYGHSEICLRLTAVTKGEEFSPRRFFMRKIFFLLVQHSTFHLPEYEVRTRLFYGFIFYLFSPSRRG